jgi:hypothetical protein
LGLRRCDTPTIPIAIGNIVAHDNKCRQHHYDAENTPARSKVK